MIKHFVLLGREPWSSGYGKRLTIPKVVGLNPGTVYWMDIFSHIFVVKIVMFLKRPKINEKEAGLAQIFFKKTFRAPDHFSAVNNSFEKVC